MRIYYFMFGKDVASLSIYTRSVINGVQTLRFKRTGNIGEYLVHWNFPAPHVLIGAIVVTEPGGTVDTVPRYGRQLVVNDTSSIAMSLK
jgi:hypothetical protein